MIIIRNRETVPGIFIERTSRFSAIVNIGGQDCNVFVPNSGRMKELLVVGTRVYLSINDEPHRKTKFDLLLVEHKGKLVSIDSRLPNEIINKGLLDRRLSQFKDFARIKREAKYYNSRLDFRLDSDDKTCYIEVKSVTLIRDKTARFPDAPTPRGSRHLRELARAVEEGHRGAIIFVIQRCDADFLSPNDVTDPEFGETLRDVVQQGVEVYAYKCNIEIKEISISGRINVVL